MKGVEEHQRPESGHFRPWTPRTRVKSTPPTPTPEIHQFTPQSFDTLKAVIFKAFAELPEARKAFCDALTEYSRLTSVPEARATP